MKRNSFPTEPAPSSAPRRAPGELDWRQMLAERWHLWLTFVVIALGGTIVYSWGMGTGMVAEWEHEIVAVHPHDPNAFTQGLHYHQGHLFESTGMEGQSSIRKVEIRSGQPTINIPLDAREFGEGLTMVGDQFYQLTWKSGVGFVYNQELQLVRKFDYTGEGWGLTFDGKHLIMSDGGTELTFLDPETLQVVRRLPVVMGSFKLDRINEMEYVDGLIFANRWQQDSIFVIHPETGRVIARVPLFNLLTPAERPRGRDDGSLNGIAYNPETKTFYVTGKKWPKMFEIRVQRKP
jgi:glutamine cyclotransferase